MASSHSQPGPPPVTAPPAAGRQWWRPILLLGLIAAALVLAYVFHIGQKLGAARVWIAALGPAGPVVFVLLYAAAVVAALPGSALSIAAGALFGGVKAVILVDIGATLGAALAFLIARYFAREAVVHWLAENEQFRRLDRLTGEHGALIVALTRLVPIFPFNLLNYGFGLTRVPFWTYVFWTWLCILPGTILYVVGADAVARTLATRMIPWLLVVALAGAFILLLILIHFARRLLKDKEGQSENSGVPPEEPPS